MKSLPLPSLLCLLAVLIQPLLVKSSPFISTNCEDLDLSISVNPAYDVILSCDNTPIILQASGNSSNGAYSIGWVNQTGQSVLIVSEPGIYTAIITDIASGCTATATSFIELIDNIPLVEVIDDVQVSCLDPCTTLNASIGGSSNVLAIEWTGPNGFHSTPVRTHH